MSQQKVDRYKQEKANRQKMIKKQKREILILKIAGSLIALALVGWVGFSVYDMTHVETKQTYEIDTTALDEYMQTLSTEQN
ncbi:hypothetical protein [Murimonas intestini]|uniref:Uncharacterized protein n=1 Tax=Murimonas intestini TaxID=1337051 RepID=A0AB73T7I0_9FIRM|nr:hypothetical protein [Murimonas intestini]MCR1841165.1 hypothetical protein [Murimonas intestini]MCR1866083.1 hypothetical protein [Murimonas intestini]MCR1882800.1 hypothetical protein [Murimonas intestini]